MELLKKLYEIHSPSEEEDKMLKFIKKWVKVNIPDAHMCRKDRNIYITKGESDTYPCVVAHTDQVQDLHGEDFTVYQHGDTVFAFSEETRSQQGLGADDKNGIWVALNLLSRYDVCKVALFHGEEIGCVGSSDADMDFFNDCRFVLQCDRKGGSDFITSASGVELCSEDFINDSGFSLFGYNVQYGMMTDVMQLKHDGLKVSACNISCGYYHPHTDQEITVFSELNNCLELCCHIFENCVRVYPHEYKRPVYEYPYVYNGCSYGNGFYYSTKKDERKDSDKIIELYETLCEDYDWILESFRNREPSESELWPLYEEYGYSREVFHEAYKDLFGYRGY